MSLKQLSTQLGCDDVSLVNWEQNHFQPTLKFIPKIIEFLGFDPFPEAEGLIGRLQKFQKKNGLRADEVSKQIGISACLIPAWERGRNKPSKKSLRKIEYFLTTVEE